MKFASNFCAISLIFELSRSSRLKHTPEISAPLITSYPFSLRYFAVKYETVSSASNPPAAALKGRRTTLFELKNEPSPPVISMGSGGV
ncbi:MAG: hypothetical protein BWY32_03620 [bacterium ADurb.Bin243]|nr:MAG: hypothetical protein BWY32_03620 [bacterium ADurb.Bin243]